MLSDHSQRVDVFFSLTVHVSMSVYSKGKPPHGQEPRPCLDSRIHPKFHYTKRRFPITSKCRQMHGVLNVDEIIN
jgi:hypothetical protein